MTVLTPPLARGTTSIRFLFALAFLLSFSPDQGQTQEPTTADLPDRPRLESIVKTLASPEYEGRRGEGGRKTAAFLIQEFQSLRLDPLFDGQFTQEIPGKDAEEPLQGRNIGALIRGRDPAVRDEWIIVSAHYDHLGVHNGVLYPGADDNASGVAMMLEVARCLKNQPEAPRRSVAFIGFDLEEAGLFGSRYFVAHPPMPLEQVSLFITADMIGRSFNGICEDLVFVMGSENAPELRPWIEAAARDRPLKVGLLGADITVLNRSDYGPFRSREVPFLFFSTGENPYYHTREDRPETLDYEKLTSISRLIHQVVLSASDAPTAPKWTKTPDYPFVEAVTIRDVLRKMLEHREKLGLGTPSLFLMNRTMKILDQVIERGTMTPAERASIIQNARLVLLMTN